VPHLVASLSRLLPQQIFTARHHNKQELPSLPIPSSYPNMA